MVTSGTLRFLEGGGEMGALLRGHAWSLSPLGDPTRWPQPLKTTVELMINSKQPMFVAWGLDLTFLYNDGFIPIFGKRHSHMAGRPFRECWPEVWKDLEPLLRRTLSGESVWFGDLHFKLERNGYPEDAWFTFSYSPVRDEAGHAVGVICVVTETTQQVLEHRRAAFRIELADELRLMVDDSKIKLRVAELLGSYLKVSCAGYAVVDDSGEYADVESEWTDGSVAGGAGRRHRLEDYGSAYLARLQSGRVTRVNDAVLDPLTASAPDGYASLQTRAAVNAPILRDGRMVGILYVLDAERRLWTDEEVALIEEVAERTASAIGHAQAERMSTQLSAQRQLALDAAQLGWWTYDPATGYSTYDPRYRAIFGIDATSGAAQELADLVHPDDVSQMWEAVARALDPTSDGTFTATFRIRRPDGEKRWVETHGIATFKGKGADRRADHLVGTIADITARRRDEEALVLEARRKDEFLAILGHELRNPMAAISNALAVLQRIEKRDAGLPQQARMQNVMHRQLCQLTRLVDDLLDVSRIGTGKLMLQVDAVVPLASVVQAAIESSQVHIDAGRHRLEVDHSPDPIIISADPSRLAQVLANLLNNAAKYTPKPGRIEVRTTRSGDRALIEVSDTGIGIAPGDIPRAFNLFTQVHDAKQEASGGLGVGLSLAQTIVQLHGGEIRISSAGLDQGCTVQVSLPIGSD